MRANDFRFGILDCRASVLAQRTRRCRGAEFFSKAFTLCVPCIPALSARKHTATQSKILNLKSKIKCGLSPAFTILELLIVIGILSILLAILLPGSKAVRTSALKRQAKVEATALAQAAIRYKAEYGFWPGELIYDTDTTTKIHPDMPDPCPVILARPKLKPQEKIEIRDQNGNLYDFLHLKTDEGQYTNVVFQALCTVGRFDGTRYLPNLLNPKGIPFLDLQNETDFRIVGYPDPWGRDYYLFMGLNPRYPFKLTLDTSRGPSEVSVSNVTAFVYSLGPLVIDSQMTVSNYIFSAGVVPW